MKSVLALMAMCLIGLIRPGSQWWRAFRQRSGFVLIAGVLFFPVATLVYGIGQGFNEAWDRVESRELTIVVPTTPALGPVREEFHRYVVRPCITGLLAQNDLSDEVTIDELIAPAKKTGHYASIEQA